MSCLLSSQSKYIFSYRFICIRQDKVSLQKKQFSKLIAANHLSIWNTVCSLRGCSIKQIHSGPVKSLSVKANVAEIYIIYTARGGMRCLMETLSERWLHDTWISSVKRKAVDMRGGAMENRTPPPTHSPHITSHPFVTRFLSLSSSPDRRCVVFIITCGLIGSAGSLSKPPGPPCLRIRKHSCLQGFIGSEVFFQMGFYPVCESYEGVNRTSRCV